MTEDIDPYSLHSSLLSAPSDPWSYLPGLNLRDIQKYEPCGYWRLVLSSFLPHTLTRVTWDRDKATGRLTHSVRNLKRYEPATGGLWRDTTSDNPMAHGHDIIKGEGVDYYRLANDIFGWALEASRKYLEYRLFLMLNKEAVSESFMYSFPRTERGCKHMLNLWCEFAKARHNYHRVYLNEISKDGQARKSGYFPVLQGQTLVSAV